ncbi:MAG: SDR family oxidoreductase [Solirubrobacteraceae bacterium]|nr:SDR family oxidoreductase [Solirubrobacteraceae bacterium]
MTPRFVNNAANPGAILLTGASGLLGGEMLERLLERTDRHVFAIVRRPLGIEHERLHEVFADLSEDKPLPEVTDAITTIIHCAASVSFTLPIDEQRAINVEGTRRLLALAEALPNLERFMHVSTAYVAGFTEGTFGPGDLERGQSFRNTYEQSKHESEVLVRSSGLPVQVVRPAIVVGDSQTGRTSSFNVIYPPLKAYARGKMQVAPGNEDATIDVVPIDYVVEGMFALLDAPVGSTHILAACQKAGTMGEVLDLGAEYFDQPRGQLLPEDQLRELIAQLPDEPREKALLALQRNEAMVPYFSVRTQYEDPETIRFLAERGVECPAFRDYFDRLMDYAEATDWGKAPAAEPTAIRA